MPRDVRGAVQEDARSFCRCRFDGEYGSGELGGCVMPSLGGTGRRANQNSNCNESCPLGVSTVYILLAIFRLPEH